MTLLLIEALGAMFLMIFIVWWTMFSGRSKGEINNAKVQDKNSDVAATSSTPPALKDTEIK